MVDERLLYNETNDVAGMESLIDVYVPSFVWNRSYLIPKRDKFNWRSPDPNGRRYGITEIKKEIDDSILDFLQGEVGRAFVVDPSVEGNIVLFASVVDGSTIHDGRKAKVVDPSCLSALVGRIRDADERAIVLRGEHTVDKTAYRLSIKVHIRTNLFTLSMIATPAQRRSDMAVLRNETDFDFFTAGFWDKIAARVLPAFPDRRGQASAMLRAIFADSRGLIISSHSIPSSKAANESFVIEKCWAEPVIAHLAPILSPVDPHSCTATYMLDRRALSVTTFGSQSTQFLPEPQPLRFVFCVHGDLLKRHEEGWARQMGHVMSRSHALTTMRLAALIDLKLLRAASVQLAQVDDAKADARRLINEYEDDEAWGAPAQKALDKLRRRLAAINTAFLKENAAGVGLTFRIESSRYYIEEFHRHVDALKLSSIDGYQSYAQTLDRNISIIFEFVSRLGVRYDRLVKEFTSIERSFSTIQARYTGNLVAELQRNGELILIGALVPYYLVGIFSHVFGGPDKMDGDAASHWRILNAFVWMACLYLATLRFLVAKHKPKRLAAKAHNMQLGVRLGSAFALAAMVLWLTVR